MQRRREKNILWIMNVWPCIEFVKTMPPFLDQLELTPAPYYSMKEQLFIIIKIVQRSPVPLH